MPSLKIKNLHSYANFNSDSVTPVSLDESTSTFTVKSWHDDKIISLEYCPVCLKDIKESLLQERPFKVNFAEVYEDWEDYGKKEPLFRVFLSWCRLPTEEEMKEFFDNLPPSGWEGVDLKEYFGDSDA